MKLGIVLYSVEPEIVWNAFRLATFARKQEDTVKIFLLAQGVEIVSIQNEKFDIQKIIKEFVQAGGEIMSCTTCVKLRNMESNDLCPLVTLKDLYAVIQESDKVVTF